ncbi:restriction endonuclease subunit S [Novispirillum sp. DQ9]|uniref:restriction endonuclease subunit S n=1 Tax=Novispirillum sp. DQ9 TaxID=3398612 RepID=UPI003C7C8D7D
MSGTLPSGWKRVPLGQCCDIISGATPSRNVPEYWGGDIPWVTPKDISRLDHPVLEDAPEKITAAGYAACSTTMMPSGSILFSSRAPIGLVAIAGRSMCTNQGFKSLVPGSDVDSGFLYWTMKRNAPRIAALGNGATFKEVSKEVVGRFEIDLPPLAEQRRIAAILDKADAIRRKRQQALALADDFLRSAFLEMFGDPVTNPKGWQVDALGDHLDFLTSGSRGWATYYDDEGADTFIRIGNVGRNRLLLDDIQYINAPDNAEARRTKVHTGDVLLSITADLGRTAVITEDLGSAYINQHLSIIRTRSIEPLFLSQFLASQGGQTQFQRLDRTGVKSGLNFDDIRGLQIPLPPRSLQQKFAGLWTKTHLASGPLQSAISSAETLFASLSQRAFRGDLLPDPVPA